MRWFANDFHSWLRHSWKSLANHPTRDQKIIIHGNSCIILYIFERVKMPEPEDDVIFGHGSSEHDHVWKCDSHLQAQLYTWIEACLFQLVCLNQWHSLYILVHWPIVGRIQVNHEYHKTTQYPIIRTGRHIDVCSMHHHRVTPTSKYKDCKQHVMMRFWIWKMLIKQIH